MEAIEERYGGKCVLLPSGYHGLKLPGLSRDKIRVILIFTAQVLIPETTTSAK